MAVPGRSLPLGPAPCRIRSLELHSLPADAEPQNLGRPAQTAPDG